MPGEIRALSGREGVDLAHAPPFRLGPVLVRPASRELVHDDGRREVLEPRVMQVLTALARARGEILSRDDLTACCWEGRVVGDDAINRVISRLRRAAEGIGAGAFRIETITKVGYRLVEPGTAGAVSDRPPAGPAPPFASRRGVLLGASAAALAAAAAGGGAWLWSRRRPALDPQVQALYEQGWSALERGEPDGNAQAIGLFRKVVEVDPDSADGWGALAFAYAISSEYTEPELRQSERARGQAAAQRGLQLEPDNVYAVAARIQLQPAFGDWWRGEQAWRDALRRRPDAVVLKYGLCYLLAAVGRLREAAEICRQILRKTEPSPHIYFVLVQALWSANFLEEAERASLKALELYPRHFAIWFTHFFLLMYSGRAGEALAFGQDRARRPTGIPEEDFDLPLDVARAIHSGRAEDAERAVARNAAAARRGLGYAENAIQFAAFLGRVDTAFEIAQAYYFGEGFTPGPSRFSPVQGGSYSSRRTYFLFKPSNANLRRDPRFDKLAERLGLKRYWAQAGVRPDYLRVG